MHKLLVSSRPTPSRLLPLQQLAGIEGEEGKEQDADGACHPVAREDQAELHLHHATWLLGCKARNPVPAR